MIYKNKIIYYKLVNSDITKQFYYKNVIKS